MWERCPQQVKFRYIEEIKMPPGIAAKIGTGVHKGAEVNHKAKLITRQDEPLAVVIDAAVDGYKKSLDSGIFFPPNEKGSAKKEINKGVDTVANLTKLYYETLAPKVQPQLVEETIIIDVPGLPLPMGGTIDLLTEDWWLPDIKTAKSKWAQNKANQSHQATLYNQLIKNHTGEFPQKLSFELFIKTKTPKYVSVETTRQPEDFILLIERAKIIWQMIRAGIFPPAEAGHWICTPKWCGYWWRCKHIPNHKKIL